VVQTDPTYTVATEWLEVPAEVAALPDLCGYGIVYDLQQAMVRDTSGDLQDLVESFVAETDPSVRNNLMEQILFKWTGVDGIAAGSRGDNIDARRLTALERLYGEAFVGVGGSNPNVNAAPLLEQSYRGMYEMFYGQLMAQSHLTEYFDLVTYSWDETTQSTRGDLTEVMGALETLYASDPTLGGSVANEIFPEPEGNGRRGMMNVQEFTASSLMQLDWVRFAAEAIGRTTSSVLPSERPSTERPTQMQLSDLKELTRYMAMTAMMCCLAIPQ
jgi:hypothetical protein